MAVCSYYATYVIFLFNSSYDKVFYVKVLYGVLEYIFNMLHWSEEVFDMVCGVLILYMLHINDLHVSVHLVYSYQYLVSCIINIV